MADFDQIERIGPRDPRILKHIQRISEAGLDLEAFAEALRGVQSDPALSSNHRDAIYKTLAQDAAQAYFTFATGKPLNLEELLGEPPDKVPGVAAAQRDEEASEE
jgi:hypothetical protein